MISDARAGLKAAIARVLQGAAWQRCRVHLMRNLLTTVPKGQAEMVAALIRTIFAQTNADKTRAQLRQVATSLERNFPKAAELVLGAEHDASAYAVFARGTLAHDLVHQPAIGYPARTSGADGGSRVGSGGGCTLARAGGGRD